MIHTIDTYIYTSICVYIYTLYVSYVYRYIYIGMCGFVVLCGLVWFLPQGLPRSKHGRVKRGGVQSFELLGDFVDGLHQRIKAHDAVGLGGDLCDAEHHPSTTMLCTAAAPGAAAEASAEAAGAAV